MALGSPRVEHRKMRRTGTAADDQQFHQYFVNEMYARTTLEWQMSVRAPKNTHSSNACDNLACVCHHLSQYFYGQQADLSNRSVSA